MVPTSNEPYSRHVPIAYVIGFCLLAWAASDVWDTFRLLTEGKPTIGSVETEDGSSHLASVHYSVEGQRYHIRGYTKGFTASLRYLPSSPKVASVDSFVNLWWIPFVKSILGALIAFGEYQRQESRRRSIALQQRPEPSPQCITQSPGPGHPQKWED